MKLSNLEISSSMRLTQPNVEDENQVLDIEFDVTKNATISNDLYALAFYKMFNGYVTGTDTSSVTTGVKFSFYDENDTIIAESIPAGIDLIIDEYYTRLEAYSETLIADSTSERYITKIIISFVSNDNETEYESLILTSIAPTTCTFAETIGESTAKGINLASGTEILASGMFKLYYKS